MNTGWGPCRAVGFDFESKKLKKQNKRRIRERTVTERATISSRHKDKIKFCFRLFLSQQLSSERKQVVRTLCDDSSVKNLQMWRANQLGILGQIYSSKPVGNELNFLDFILQKLRARSYTCMFSVHNPGKMFSEHVLGTRAFIFRALWNVLGTHSFRLKMARISVCAVWRIVYTLRNVWGHFDVHSPCW